MLILSLDTTTRGGSVAVTDDDRVVAVLAGDVTRTHGERLPGEIDAVLAEAAVTRTALDLLVVASGPGGFTGLRIGLAAMQGLAMTLDRPIVGVSALDALAWSAIATRHERPADGDAIATWMDASRGEVFSGVYRPTPDAHDPWRVDGEPAAGAPEALLAAAPFDRLQPTLFIGDGARRHADAIALASTAWHVSHDEPLLAPALAALGRRLALAGLASTPHALQPLYVRRPDVELERDRRTGS